MQPPRPHLVVHHEKVTLHERPGGKVVGSRRPRQEVMVDRVERPGGTREPRGAFKMRSLCAQRGEGVLLTSSAKF